MEVTGELDRSSFSGMTGDKNLTEVGNEMQEFGRANISKFFKEF